MARGTIIYGNPVRYFVNDKEVTKDEYDAAFPSKLADLFASGETLAAHQSSCWPMKSEAMACHPDQIPAIMERDRKAGVPTQRDRAGRPILTSRAHRRALMRVEGYHDNNGGYGD